MSRNCREGGVSKSHLAGYPSDVEGYWGTALKEDYDLVELHAVQ